MSYRFSSLSRNFEEIITGDLVRAVSEMPLEELRSYNHDQLADLLVPKLEVRPVSLKKHEQRLRIRETQLNEEGKFNRFDSPFQSHGMASRAPFVMGLEMTLVVPYDGDGWLLDCMADTELPERPEFKNGNSSLSLTLSLPHDSSPFEYQVYVKKQIALIEKHILVTTEQVREFNRKLPDEVRKASMLRRHLLDHRKMIASILGVPLTD